MAGIRTKNNGLTQSTQGHFHIKSPLRPQQVTVFPKFTKINLSKVKKRTYSQLKEQEIDPARKKEKTQIKLEMKKKSQQRNTKDHKRLL